MNFLIRIARRIGTDSLIELFLSIGDLLASRTDNEVDDQFMEFLRSELQSEES